MGHWLPPEQLGTADVESFLNHLVGERRDRRGLAGGGFVVGGELGGEGGGVGSFICLGDEAGGVVVGGVEATDTARALTARPAVGGRGRPR
jgi:hypothetical protein